MWTIKWIILGLIFLIFRNKIKTAKNPYLVCIGIFSVFITITVFISLFAGTILSLGTELQSQTLIEFGQAVIDSTSFNLYYSIGS